MSDDYGEYCLRCAQRVTRCNCFAGPLRPRPPRSADERALLATYVNLRRDCVELEKIIAGERSIVGDDPLTLEDLSRLDKAVTVMKVGFKLVKKVLRKRGVEGLKRWREEATELQP